MKKAVSSLRILLLLPFLAVLFLTSGCAQKKVFDFSVPVAQVKPAPKMLSEDSTQIVAISVDTAVPANSPEAYQLEASIAQPAPAKFPPGYTAASVVSTQALGNSKIEKLAKRKGKTTAQGTDSSLLPLPTESKAALVFAIISLITLGVVILPGFTLGTYLIAMLIGLIAFIFSFTLGLLGKSKGAKQPEKYNARGAKRIGVLSWILATLLALILLGLLIV